MNPGDIVRHRGHRGALYRVQSIDGTTANVFGGPRRQARALPLSDLEPASKRDAETFERVRAAELAALRRRTGRAAPHPRRARAPMSRKRWVGPPLEPGDPRHGTNNGYQNYACRCDPCRAAHYEYHQARGYGERYRRRLGMLPWAEHLARLPTPAHGTRTSYKNGCRCADCTRAERDYRRAYRAGRRVAR